MKRLIVASILILAAGTISYGSGLTATLASYPINLNGQRLAATPLNVNGSTYLPVRTVSEALGVDIGWTGSSVEIHTVDVDKLKEACVMIYAYGDGMTSQGSGVYVDYDKILTAYHVVDEDRNMIWDSSDKTATFSAINFDSGIDIATLQASKKVKPVRIGDSDEVRVGDQVIVVGAPGEKVDTIIYATVKQLNNEIVLSTQIGGGASGGAVFNANGELVGVVVAGDDGLQETYVTPINLIREKL